MDKPFITLTSDFGWGSKGVGIMKAVALRFSPNANVINITHDVKPFDLVDGARHMECTTYVPVGNHVCVVDPGVGTERKALIIKTKRGDNFIGPNNGVLIPATERFFGGIVKVVEITNQKYMLKPVSSIFHGRDVFTPAAAHLANGVSIDKFGPKMDPKKLEKAPYEEAKINKKKITAHVIHVNRYGNVFLNMIYNNFKKLSNIKIGDSVKIMTSAHDLETTFVNAFGDVDKGDPAFLPDDFGRVELALNQGDFSDRYGVGQGDRVDIMKT